MDCPRCGQKDVQGPDCPRCGVILARFRTERARPRPGVEPAPAAASFSWRIVAVLGAVLAVVVATGQQFRNRRHASPGSPAPGQAEASPPLPPRVTDLPAPPPVVPVPPPSVSLPAEPSAALSEEDAKATRAIADRINNRVPLGPADLQTAEALYRRFPEENGIRSLLESVLLTLAAQERAARHFSEATAHARRAIAVSPAALVPRVALMDLFLETGDWSGAEAAARDALALSPRHAEALEGLGYALFRQDRNREAAEALRAALEIRDSAGARHLLDRIRKGLADERGMTEQRLSHFNVRYDGDAHDEVGREILRALERHFATLTRIMDHEPSTTIPVILFSRQAYYDAAGAPAWSGGVYDPMDGRIRVPIGGLTSSLTPDMDGVLIHELAHAFIADRSRGQAPREIHEGLAQFMEGKRFAAMLRPDDLRALADGRAGGTVLGFYIEALSFVEHLMASRGQGGMNDMLKAMGETGSVDAAFRQVYGQSYRDAQVGWRERLRRQYGS